MKTYQVDENGYYGEFEEHMCPKYFTNVWKTCRRSISKYWKATVSRKNSTSYFGTMSAALLLSIKQKGWVRCMAARYIWNVKTWTIPALIRSTTRSDRSLCYRRMGKTRIIAETGAGQHGVATATVCALMNMECIVYMGKTDVERLNMQTRAENGDSWARRSSP